jgi:hypothetical protein
MKQFTLTLTIECLDHQTTSQAVDRLKRWLENYGHTSPGHGFDFTEIGTSQKTKATRKKKTKP